MLRIETAMADLHITLAALFRRDEILLELSDGRSLTLSLAKLLTLVPDSVVTEEDPEKVATDSAQNLSA